MLSLLKTLFMGLLKKSRSVYPVLLAVIFVLILVAIWWAGPWLVYQQTHPLQSILARTLTSVMFILICCVIWGITQWHRLQNYRGKEEKNKQYQNDPILKLEENQQKELDQVVLALKKNLNKRNYLYALPWYIVLGLENAGKTSMINRSGQNFVFSSVMRAAGQQKKTRYGFDWWIGDQSVLIDPDGELLTQGAFSDDKQDNEIQKRLWLHFIKWLDNTRSRRPLNGVVIAIDISYLASSTNSERMVHANLIRARLRELMETLSTRMPVYITLTKLDLLYGFEPFFRHYSRQEREEVMGFTFTLNSVNDVDSWLNEFKQDIHGFVEKINRLVPGAMMQCLDSSDREAIYTFSRQLAGLESILATFFTQAFASDQFSTSALVRGVYMTSVYQQGVPSNVFLHAAADRYGLPQGVNRAQQAANSTTYFIQKLFSQVIYPEAGLAADSLRVSRNKRRINILSGVVCCIVVVLVIGSWQHYYQKNVNQADAVLKKVSQYKNSYAQAIAKGSDNDILNLLNIIHDATLEFGQFHDKPHYVSDMGLYQGHQIGPKVEQTYLDLLETRFLPLLMKDIATDLANAKSPKTQLDALRVYRMLTDKSGRYQNFVQNYFAQLWQQRYEGNRDIQVRLMQHLNYAMSHTDLQLKRDQGDTAVAALMQPYDDRVKSVQHELSQTPIEQWVYSNLKTQANIHLGAPLNLSAMIGPVFDVVFDAKDTQSLQIPQVLTRKGYQNYFIKQSSDATELALVDRWVLGETSSVNFSDQDKMALRDKVRELYVADYINTWRAALNTLNMKYFPDINGGVFVLQTITNTTQPLSRLLSIVQENTHLLPDLSASKDEASNKAVMATSEYHMAAEISREFADLNNLTKAQGDKPSYISEVQDAINQLQAYIKSINDAPDVGQAALDALKKRTMLSNADPIYVLQRISSSLPSPMDVMMKKLADQSWYVIRQAALRNTELLWNKDIYTPFQHNLAPYYPFNPNSKKDVSLTDFEQFFSPNGTLSQFYTNNLKFFIDTDQSLGQNALIQDNVKKQLDQFTVIQRAFFNNKGLLSVSFGVEPLEMSANKRRSILNIEGQYVQYDNGPSHVTELIWPNELRQEPTTSLTLVPTSSNLSPRSLTKKGPWALFHLLDQAKVTAVAPDSINYQFVLDSGSVSYRLYPESQENPFTMALFKTFNLPKTLY